MALAIETAGQGQSLVCIHGWGMNRMVWQPLLSELSQYFHVISIDLPGHGHSEWCSQTQQTLAQWAQQIVQVIPKQPAIFLGWSLGALLVWHIASFMPQRVKNWLTVAATPCFVARDDWSFAMSKTLFNQFEQDLKVNPNKTWKRFLALQRQNDPNARQIKQYCREQNIPHIQALQAGLTILKQTDFRCELTTLNSGNMILAERDALIPIGLLSVLKNTYPQIKVLQMDDVGHVPFLSKPDVFMALLKRTIL